jgi:16S rRNA processing protein RimM
MAKPGNAKPGNAKPGKATSAPPGTAVAHPPRHDRICVAQVGAPHGIRGEVRLWSFTAHPRAIAGYGALETPDGSRFLEIETLRSAKDCLIVRFKGVTDRDAAERLCGLALYVARDRLPEPAQDEFYHADMIGLEAFDRAGKSLGKVIAVHNFGAGDLLDIGQSDRTSFLLPFTAATVPSVDIASGRILIDPLPGLLEETQGNPHARDEDPQR